MLDLNELIESVDIVDYISQFVDFEERNGEYWSLSPFKEEKTPSFSVRRETGRFYDFSSGLGGNVYTFIKHYFKCSSQEAVKRLSEYAGCTDLNYTPHKKMAATMVCKKFKPNVTQKKHGKQSVFPDNCMEKFEKREDKLMVWEREGISRASLDKFQVYYDEFSDRLVYPIKNLDGKIVNIGGRTLDPEWKAKKLRKYTYFAGWTEMNVLYGLYDNLESIVKKKEIIIFEGCKSVLLADTWGIHNTSAILTSHLNNQQFKILAKLGCRVVFALDKDVKIRDDHNIKKLKRYVNVEYIYDATDLTSEKDSPVDKGQETFTLLYNKRIKYR